MRTTLHCLAVLCLGASLHADVVLAPLFTDHAVLQQGKPVPVWGTADAGEKVTVAFRGDTAATTADAGGRWQVKLKKFDATAEPAELVVTGKNKIALTDVVVGEVWLASGQSNMEWVVKNVDNADAEIKAANFPQIRHIKIAKKVSEQPLATASGAWQVTTPETVPGFTAVGYFFARNLHQKLNIPVGIVHSSWGGTPVESWLSPESLAGSPDFKIVNDRWAKVLADYPAAKAKFDAATAAWTAEEAAAKAAGEKFTKAKPRGPNGPGHPNTPSGLYNGMINPLVPYALRGAIWYQGESNAGRANEYRKLFGSMIDGWREAFGQGDFPFYWVQLANYNSGDGNSTVWAFLREAQDQTLALKHTGQALAIDVGNPTDIHPRNKQDVGRRLALIALAQDYGQSVDFSGPRFKKAKVDGAAIRVTFAHADGLNARTQPPQSFEIAGEDKKFVPATARLDGEAIVVSAPEVPAPVAVRYAWRNNPTANIYNGAGLPLAPFRSDSW